MLSMHSNLLFLAGLLRSLCAMLLLHAGISNMKYIDMDGMAKIRMIWDEYNRIQRLEYNQVLHQRKPLLAYINSKIVSGIIVHSYYMSTSD